MRLYRIFYFIAVLLTLSVYGFGQRVPVAPSMLLGIGGLDAAVYSSSMKFDAQGNTYVTGHFTDRYDSADFDPSAGVTTLGIINSSSGYVAKYSAAGALVWVKLFKGESNGLDVDRNGNVTVIGERHPNIAPPNTIYVDAFILHLDNNGNVLWEKLIQSGSKDRPMPPPIGLFQDVQVGYKVTSDDAGNLIAVYTFMGSPDLNGKITAKGYYDGLVVKYDPNGNVIWKFNLGATGSFNNSALEVLVDKDNNIILAGYTSGEVNYNPLGTAVNVTAYNSMFLAQYSPAGILQWIKSIKGSQSTYNVRLALDGQNNIYINGAFTREIDFGIAPKLKPNGSQDIFIAKYSSGGNVLYYKSIGGSGAAVYNAGVATGPDNSLYLTGSFSGKVDIDLFASVTELNSDGTTGMFLTKYDDNGNYQWGFRVPRIYSGDVRDVNSVGGDLKLGAQDINVNSSNEIFVTGGFQSTVNFNGTGCGVNSLTAKNASDPTNGSTDMFIVRYTPTLEIPVTNNTVTVPVITDICPGVDPGLITGSIPVGSNYTYQWQQSLDNRTFTDINGSVSKDFDPPVLSATMHYRRRLVTSECAALNISNVITLTPVQSVTVNTITAPPVLGFCNAGDAELISGSVPQGVGTVNYQWQQSTDSISFTNINGATSKEYDPPSLSVTTYYRRLILHVACNTVLTSNTIVITINSLPEPKVSAEKTVCIGDGVTLNATGGIRYSWSPAVGLSATNVASPTAKPTTTTNYAVTVYNGFCTKVLQVKVIVVESPTVNAGADMEIMNGDEVQLNTEVSNVEGATYSWTPTIYLDDPTIANPIASPTDQITYLLTVKSANGCFIVSDEVVIDVREKVMIPNAFTPNGDGVNDILTIPGLDSYKQSTLTFFDRNGQRIFKSLAYPKPWDGTHNGKSLPTGTYYYVIDLNNSERKRLSGAIFLIK
ncbi:gliding motility-associated C-terminal domain-containing protein [Pedobacter psychroterrae]|nr:gliding motility-associated C-terminal domain-containing protein [Pedobacter psychroterrae]